MKVERTIQILTPAFVAGADPLASPAAIEREGVRYPTISAGLRWWFRALAGGLLGTSQLKTIRDMESLIFGSALPIDLPRAGRTSLQLPNCASRLHPRIFNQELHPVRFEPLPKSASREEKARNPADNRDLVYLAYGLHKQKGVPGRCYLSPGDRFMISLRIAPPRHAEEPEIDPKLIEVLLTLWVQYGGLGGRWRHGFGGMEIPDATLPLQENLAAIIRGELTYARKQVRQFLQTVNPDAFKTPETELPSFPVVDQKFLSVKFKRRMSSADWKEALLGIKHTWRTSRQQDPLDRLGVSKNRSLFWDYLDNQPVADAHLHSAGLGLPIPFGFPQVWEDVTGVASPSGEAARRASPIWFRLRRVQGGQLVPIALLWTCEYLPPGTSLALTSGGLDTIPASFDPDEATRWFGQYLASPDWEAVAWQLKKTQSE